jgi:PEP-CTERM motif
MKKVITKTLLAASLTAVLGVGSTSAMADFLPFSIKDPVSAATFSNLGVIGGNYQEEVTFGAGTFSSSLLWHGTGLADVTNANVSGPTQNLNFGYGLYALYMFSGTWSTSGGITNFYFSPGGTLSLYEDPTNTNTYGSYPANGTTPFAVTDPGPNDKLLASGSVSTGSGQILCSGNNNCGSFGVTSAITLTSDGSNYFTSPIPFYNFSLQSGNFNAFVPSAGLNQSLQGVANVVFVPEPESLALLGIGLLGMAMARRSRKQA